MPTGLRLRRWREFALSAGAMLLVSCMLGGASVGPGFSMQESHVGGDSLSPPCDARAMLTRGRYQEAEACVRSALARKLEDADSRFLLGYVLYKEQRWTESLAAYTEASRLRAPTADDLLTVAADYIRLGSYADAERWLLAATRLFPLRADAWYLLGGTEYNLDHAEDAKAAFLKCLKLEPDRWSRRTGISICYIIIDRLL